MPPAAPDFVDTWPVHCVAETPGAALHPEMAALAEELGERVEIVRKGYGIPSYSVLEGTVVATGESVQDLLAAGDWERVDVVGLAYDFCVRATALGAVAAGAPVRVLSDLTAAVHAAGIPALEQELAVAGVEVTAS
ncbi:isochorismatase family protein [Brachybacterium vulturis]|uniref:isochorismatase family protein n=1 Tax=Brachybacterium vulturis TaxID=2017484 RepID=UPI00267B7D93